MSMGILFIWQITKQMEICPSDYTKVANMEQKNRTNIYLMVCYGSGMIKKGIWKYQ